MPSRRTVTALGAGAGLLLVLFENALLFLDVTGAAAGVPSSPALVVAVPTVLAVLLLAVLVGGAIASHGRDSDDPAES